MCSLPRELRRARTHTHMHYALHARMHFTHTCTHTLHTRTHKKPFTSLAPEIVSSLKQPAGTLRGPGEWWRTGRGSLKEKKKKRNGGGLDGASSFLLLPAHHFLHPFSSLSSHSAEGWCTASCTFLPTPPLMGLSCSCTICSCPA